MHPLLHSEPLELQICNPYYMLSPSRSKNAAPITFWVPRVPKTQPLLHSEALEVQKCNPYYILSPSRSKNATPIMCWAPRAPKMQPLLHSKSLELQTCNPYCVLGRSRSKKAITYYILGPPSSRNVTPIACWAPRAPKMQPPLHSEPLELPKCNPYCPRP